MAITATETSGAGALPVGEQPQNTANGKDSKPDGEHEESLDTRGALQRQESDQGGERKRKRRAQFEQPAAVADAARNKLRIAMANAMLSAVEDDFEGVCDV